jgi:tetratricopeptide (TPR) repeat protein
MRPQTPALQLTRPKRIVFATILGLLLLIVPLLTLEGLVRALGWRTADDPFIHFGRVASFFSDFEYEGMAYKEVTARALYREREVAFPRTKPAGTFRIFCLGSSASAGWPHPGGEIYSAYLESALRLAYPDREIEVINVSAQAYAAYRTRLILQEVVSFQPDLIVIYAGNNEFLEPRRYATGASWYDPLATLAGNSTLYELLRGSPLGARLWPRNTLQPQVVGGVAFEQWSKIEQIPVVLRTDPAQFRKVAEHYEFSIASMLRSAKARGIPVILLTVPSNLRDWQPHVSLHAAGDRPAWDQRYAAGRAALLKGEAGAAVELLARAAALDEGHAATHYHLGRALEAAGRSEEAYASYVRARDLDANPFRAVSAFNDIVRRVGKSFGNATVLDMESAFRAASHPLAPGFDLFLDYVHPTKKGNLVVAKGVFEKIVEGGYLGPAAKAFEHVPETDDDGASYDEARDDDLHQVLLYIAMMMHQNETVVSIADRLAAMPGVLEWLEPEDARSLSAAREIFRALVELERRELLEGSVPQAEKEQLLARLNRLYRDVFGNYVEYQGRRWQ